MYCAPYFRIKEPDENKKLQTCNCQRVSVRNTHKEKVKRKGKKKKKYEVG